VQIPSIRIHTKSNQKSAFQQGNVPQELPQGFVKLRNGTFAGATMLLNEKCKPSATDTFSRGN